MEPVIQSLPARHVVGLGAKFISVLSPERNNFVVIPRLWHEFVNRQDEIPNRADKNALGCVFCEEGTNERYYLACVEVTTVSTIPAGMESLEIPEGNHAVFIHKGTLDTLGETMEYIHRSWMPGSGCQRRDAPELEIYGDRFDLGSDDSELIICVPIL